MKGYYLFAPVEPGCVGPESGIERKVRTQHKALLEYFDCELMVLPPVEYSGSIPEKILRRLPFTAAWRKWKYHGEFNDADFLYIRQVYHDASFVRYLRAIRRQNPKIRIIYELPTYPYLNEQKNSLGNLAFRKKETRWCKRAAKYMDRTVTFYGQDEIWGIPCIKLINGFDFSRVKLPERSAPKDVQIISVAANAFWHGYDRLIEGLRLYYDHGGTERIIYHIVGSDLPELRKLVKDGHLEQHVVFHGVQSGDALRKLYEQSYLGVDVLGGHRKNYPVSSSLKSREYCAYGLPILTASPIDFLPDDYPYQMVVPYDDSPIDIPALLSFYSRCYRNVSSVEIRSFAEARCDIRQTMKPIADWLNGN
ncbi:MAG: glycosyltransferase [Oscillospiraceae bacterium]|nr:glycosyltransferase [Oscillospiraceae bacterium]